MSTTKKRRQRRRGNRGGNTNGATPTDGKKVSASSRLANRLGKDRRRRAEWNQAVKVLINTTWMQPPSTEGSALVELTGTFGKTMEQFASIQMPCNCVELSECTQVALRLLQTYQILCQATGSHPKTTPILSQSLVIFCTFVRNVCTEQQAPFTAAQLTALVPFLLSHVSATAGTIGSLKY